MAGVFDVHRRMEEKPETQVVRVGEIDGRTSWVLQIGGLRGRLRGMRDHNPTSVSRTLTARGRGARAVVACGGECKYCWRPSSLVLVVRGRGARLWCWFHKAKLGFAHI